MKSRLHLITVSLAISFLQTQASAIPFERVDAPPNIIVIMSDDVGYSDTGCYGGEIETPSLDALARSGVRFTQFYNTARCCPTRESLLTGLYAHRAGIGHMMDGASTKAGGAKYPSSASGQAIQPIVVAK